MNSISPNLNLMIKACEKASKVIIRDFGELENLQVSKKGPKDFVTKTDKRVEKILIEELSKSKKNYSFITEETGKIINKNKDIFWIIDPIDGTTNFLHGIPHFAISVALQKEGEIILQILKTTKNGIISPPGSIIYYPKVIDYLKNNKDYLIIYLECSLESILKRTNHFKDRGVVMNMNKKDPYLTLYNERVPYYESLCTLKVNSEQDISILVKKPTFLIY